MLTPNFGFSVNRNGSNQTVTSGVTAPLDYTNALYNTYGVYDLSTDLFTAPIDGYYLFNSHVRCFDSTEACVTRLMFKSAPDADPSVLVTGRAVGSSTQTKVTHVVYLEQENQVYQDITNNFGTTIRGTNDQTFFDGNLLREATSSPYYIDPINTIMLGGILMILIGMWLFKLTKN